MVGDKAERIVQGKPTSGALNSTGFFLHLWRDYPKLSRQMDTMLRQRRASGRVARSVPYLWLIGTGGLHVEPMSGPPGSALGSRGMLGEYPVVLDELLERGRVKLVAVEWEGDTPRP